MCEVRYEDLLIVFQSDGAATDEIDPVIWRMLMSLRALQHRGISIPESWRLLLLLCGCEGGDDSC